jgi:carbamoyltransferase
MLTSVAKELLLNFDLKDSTAEYMVSTFQASDQLKKKSPAVVHIDGTCRAQIINYDENDFLSKLLDKLYKDFSIDCLINTSFNLHEEPIVSDHQSAFNTFIISNIDALVCPPVIILK